MSSPEFRDTLLELIETSPEPVDHPSPDRWIAYHRGELPAGEEARLQEHLVRCRDCFDLAGAAAAFAQPDEEPGAGQEVETAALWRLLRPQLAPPLDPQRSNAREISARPPRQAWRGRLPTTLAASFFVALLGVTAWSFHQQSVLETVRKPRPNAPLFEIAGGDRALAGRELTTTTGTRMFVFYPGEEAAVYRLAIRDAATRQELYSFDDLRPNRVRALTLYLPEGLPPGRYRLDLRAGGALETHLLRVTKAGRE
ncbi:MAG: zf-HC2 domain-containing protein [Thermoanaerobaculia bacterium]